MRRRTFLQKQSTLALVVIILAIVIVGLFMGLGGLPASGQAVSVSSFQTDKDQYHSKEIMKVQVTLTSDTRLENVRIFLEGIKDRYGELHLKKNTSLTIIPGTNTVNLEYQLPTCSTCSGIDPGDYPINLSVVQNGVQIARGVHTVHLEQ
jgi:hypothetical protein